MAPRQGRRKPNRFATVESGACRAPYSMQIFGVFRWGLGGHHQAVYATALQLGTGSLALLGAGERADPHAVERSHVAHHGLIDLGLAHGERIGVLAPDALREGLCLGLSAHHADLDAEPAFRLASRRALPHRTGAAAHLRSAG